MRLFSRKPRQTYTYTVEHAVSWFLPEAGRGLMITAHGTNGETHVTFGNVPAVFAGRTITLTATEEWPIARMTVAVVPTVPGADLT